MKKKKKDELLINGKPIKHGSIVPLIGGNTIAAERVFKSKPAFFLSFDAFAANDSHCRNYYPETPYYSLGDGSILDLPIDVSPDLFLDVDVMTTLCPCAGLSMLNANNSNDSDKARGSDAVQNEWMYRSAMVVLEKIKPKVFWGENAPGLYTTMGEGVIKKLKEIAKANDYSLSVIKTNTFLHGIPQNRMRTFYFFWNNKTAPIFKYYKKNTPTLEEYLNLIPENTTSMDKYFGLGDLSENNWVKFIKYKGWDLKQAMKSESITILQLILNQKWLDECLEWGEKNEYQDVIKFLSHVKKKMADNKGWWDHTPLIFDTATNAIIAKNAGIVHPNGERGINLREAMWLMGLPHDFVLTEDKHWNHICQNVPVNTAADCCTEILKYLQNEVDEYGGSFVKQNNINQKIDLIENNEIQKELF